MYKKRNKTIIIVIIIITQSYLVHQNVVQMTSGVDIPGNAFRITRNVITIRIVTMDQTRTTAVSVPEVCKSFDIIFNHSNVFTLYYPIFASTLNT